MNKFTSSDSSDTSTDAEVEKTENVKTEAAVKAPKKPGTESAEVVCHPGEGRYYYQLTSIASGLTLGVLALMTFLLTVGLQNSKLPSHNSFKFSLYASIGLLGLSLAMPVVAHLFKGTVGHKYVRILQQVVFVAAVVAVVSLALSTASFFFNIPAQPTMQ